MESLEAVFKRGLAPGSVSLHESPAVIPSFLNYLFTSKNAHVALEWCTWIISGKGSEPKKVFEKIKSASGVCGKVWAPGQLAYKCRTCEHDPTCAICVPCFNKSNHEGHDFAMITTGGGMCDCGDPTAWDPKGFCKDHGGPDSVDPLKNVPPTMLAASKVALSSVLSQLRAVVADLTSPSTKLEAKREHLDKALPILNWLEKFVAMSEATKRMVQNAFLESPVSGGESAESFLLFAMERDVDMPLAATEILHRLYMGFLVNMDFKRAFASGYARNFTMLVEKTLSLRGLVAQDRISDQHSIFSFSVQLLTVPPILDFLVDEHDILSTILANMETCMTSSRTVQTVRGRRVLSLRARELPNLFYTLLMDFKYCLMDPRLPALMLHHRHDLFAKWLKFMALLQGCLDVERIESDEDTWVRTMGLETELHKHVALVCAGARHPQPLAAPGGRKPFCLSDVQLSQSPESSAATVANLQSLLGLVSAELCKYLDTQPNMETHATANPAVPKVIKFEVVNGPVTFHLPLHRVLSLLIHEAASHLSFSPHSASPDSSLTCRLLEHPLRLSVLISQVNHRLWNRNPVMVMQQTAFYCSTFFQHARGLDLFLLQSCCALLGPEHFLTITIDRHSLRGAPLFPIDSRPRPSEHPPSESDEQIGGLAEDLLRFVAMLASDRTMCGETAEQTTRRMLVHRLALGKQTHSQLHKAISKRFLEGVDFDSVLKAVSVFTRPTTAAQQGSYALKDECWANEVDPFFLFFTRREFPRLEEAYEEHRQSKGDRARAVMLPPKPTQPYPAWSVVSSFLHSRVLHQVLSSVLLNAYIGSPLAPDTLINTTLQLLHLATLTYDDHLSAQSRPSRTGSTAVTPSQSLKTMWDIHLPSENDLLANARAEFSTDFAGEKQSLMLILLRLLHRKDVGERKGALTKLVEWFETRDAGGCGKVISEYRAELERQEEELRKQKAASGAVTEEQKKELAKKRQQDMLAKFAAKQASFSQHSQLTEEEEDEQYLGDESTTMTGGETDESTTGGEKARKVDSVLGGLRCALCHEAASPSGNKSLGLVALVSRSRVLRIAQAQGHADHYTLHAHKAGTPCSTPNSKAPAAAPSGGASSADQRDAEHVEAPHTVPQQPMREEISEEEYVLNVMEETRQLQAAGEAGMTDLEREGVLVSPGEDEDSHDVIMQLGEEGPFDEEEEGSELSWQTVSEGEGGHEGEEEGSEDFAGDYEVMSDEEEPLEFDAEDLPFNTASPAAAAHSDHPERIESKTELEKLRHQFLAKHAKAAPHLEHVFSHVGGNDGAHVHFCGHALHLDCLASQHMPALLKAHFEGRAYKGDHVLDLESGEFLCPLCGRLSNTLCPVLPPGSPSDPLLLTTTRPPPSATTTTTSPLDALPTVPTEDQPQESGGDKALDQALDSLALQLSKIHTAKSVEATLENRSHKPIMVSAFAHVLSSIELTQRSKEGCSLSTPPETTTAALRSLIRAIAAQKAEEKEISQTSCSSVVAALKGELSSDEHPLLPALSCDPFSLLVQTLFLHSPTSLERFPPLIGMLLSLQITQSALSFCSRFPSLEPERQPHALAPFFSFLSSTHSPSSLLPKSPQKSRGASSTSAPTDQFSIENWKEVAQATSLPFLRRAALLSHVLFCQPLPTVGSLVVPTDGGESSSPLPVPVGGNEDTEQFRALCKYLHVPCDVEEWLREGPLVRPWLDQLAQVLSTTPTLAPELAAAADEASVKLMEQQLQRALLPSPIPARPFRLLSLPPIYQTLYEDMFDKKCKKCQTVPKVKSLCLTCGTLVCTGAACCRRGPFGETSQHAISCGSGVAMFVVLNKSTVLVLRNGIHAFLGSPYLDSHGEEDRDLRRGKPLHLDSVRLQELYRMFVENSFDQETFVLELSAREHSNWF